MIDFIKSHKKIIIALAVFIILVLLSIVIYQSVNQNSRNQDNQIDYSETSYEFLETNISEQDKYLMLLGKIAVEDYGTYSFEDSRPLYDLKNQSTESYVPVVQSLIDELKPGESLVTTADPDSIELEYSSGGQSALITLNAESIDGRGVKNNFKAEITFIKEGEYWLVDKIVTK